MIPSLSKSFSDGEQKGLYSLTQLKIPELSLGTCGPIIIIKYQKKKQPVHQVESPLLQG